MLSLARLTEVFRPKVIYIRRKSWLVNLWSYSLHNQADTHLRGSTFVHMDKSAAVNVMPYTDESSSNASRGARWDIWPMSSIASLSKALEPSASDEDCALGQAIISGLYYASPEIISKAFSISGIRRWIIDQIPGEAVIIPPGCPHQVPQILTVSSIC